MLKVANIWIGWRDPGSVSEISRLADVAPELMASFEYALISRIDSDDNPNLAMPSFSRLVNELGFPIQQFGRQLLTTGKVIVQMAVEIQFFWGFDEVWFFRQEPGEQLPEDFIIPAETTFRSPEGERRLLALAEWMSRSGAVLGLGDGINLKYVTIDEKIAELLDRI